MASIFGSALWLPTETWKPSISPMKRVSASLVIRVKWALKVLPVSMARHHISTSNTRMWRIRPNRIRCLRPRLHTSERMSTLLRLIQATRPTTPGQSLKEPTELTASPVRTVWTEELHISTLLGPTPRTETRISRQVSRRTSFTWVLMWISRKMTRRIRPFTTGSALKASRETRESRDLLEMTARQPTSTSSTLLTALLLLIR